MQAEAEIRRQEREEKERRRLERERRRNGKDAPKLTPLKDPAEIETFGQTWHRDKA